MKGRCSEEKEQYQTSLNSVLKKIKIKVLIMEKNWIMNNATMKLKSCQ